MDMHRHGHIHKPPFQAIDSNKMDIAFKMLIFPVEIYQAKRALVPKTFKTTSSYQLCTILQRNQQQKNQSIKISHSSTIFLLNTHHRLSSILCPVLQSPIQTFLKHEAVTKQEGHLGTEKKHKDISNSSVSY